jgi:hypothetical protein
VCKCQHHGEFVVVVAASSSVGVGVCVSTTRRSARAARTGGGGGARRFQTPKPPARSSYLATFPKFGGHARSNAHSRRFVVPQGCERGEERSASPLQHTTQPHRSAFEAPKGEPLRSARTPTQLCDLAFGH